METYEIIMTPNATQDLVELRDYIAYTLLASNTALSYVRAIRDEIESLSTMPGRNSTVADEPWHSRGVRRVIGKKFFIYYRIDQTAKRVYILNIIYAKRDQLRMLAQMKDN